MQNDPHGFHCQGPAGGRRSGVLHEPMPADLAGAPRWLSPDTSGARATAGADTDSGPQAALQRDREGRARRRALFIPEVVRIRLRHALVRLRDLARFRMALW